MASEAARRLLIIIQGVDEFTPVGNRINGSLTNMGRTVNTQMGGMNRSTGLLSEQFRILRRTAEYAVAGFGLYKVYQAISAYKTFRSELGLLNANLMTTGANLEQVANSALKVSTATVTPLADIVASYQNLAATFPGISLKTLPVFSTVEAKASRVMQVAPQDIGAAIGGLATTFYGRQALMGKNGSKLINQIANQLVYTQFTNPNLSGQDITSFIPPLGGFASAAQFTLPQTLALFSGVQRQLIKPATSAQYLRQLLIRLRKPTKSAQPYFDEAIPGGLTAMSKMKGIDILDRLIKYGLSLPGSSMNYEQARKAGFKGIKIGGPAGTFFQETVGGRQQSLVAITGIVRNFGQVVMQEQKLMGLSADSLNKRWQAWLDQNRLTQAATAFSNMTTGMINDLNPLIQKTGELATHIADLGTSINTDYQKGARILNKDIFGPVVGGNNAARFHLGGITEIAGTALAIIVGKKLGIFGKVGSALSKLPFANKLLGKSLGGEGLAGDIVSKYKVPLDLQAISSAMTGTANGTPGAPFWVVIHPLSAMTVPGMFGGKKNQGPQSATSPAEKLLQKAEQVGKSGYTPAAIAAAAVKRKALARLAERVGRLAMKVPEDLLPGIGKKALFGAGPAGIIAAVLTSDGTVINIPGTGAVIGSPGGGFARRVPKGGLLDRIFNMNRGVPKTAWTTNLEQQWLHGNISTARFEQMLRTHDPYLTARSAAGTGVIGQADINATFWLQPDQELKNLLKPQKVRVHVPTKLFGGVGSPAPTTKARVTARNNL